MAAEYGQRGVAMDDGAPVFGAPPYHQGGVNPYGHPALAWGNAPPPAAHAQPPAGGVPMLPPYAAAHYDPHQQQLQQQQQHQHHQHQHQMRRRSSRNLQTGNARKRMSRQQLTRQRAAAAAERRQREAGGGRAQQQQQQQRDRRQRSSDSQPSEGCCSSCSCSAVLFFFVLWLLRTYGLFLMVLALSNATTNFTDWSDTLTKITTTTGSFSFISGLFCIVFTTVFSMTRDYGEDLLVHYQERMYRGYRKAYMKDHARRRAQMVAVQMQQVAPDYDDQQQQLLAQQQQQQLMMMAAYGAPRPANGPPACPFNRGTAGRVPPGLPPGAGAVPFDQQYQQRAIVRHVANYP